MQINSCYQLSENILFSDDCFQICNLALSYTNRYLFTRELWFASKSLKTRLSYSSAKKYSRQNRIAADTKMWSSSKVNDNTSNKEINRAENLLYRILDFILLLEDTRFFLASPSPPTSQTLLSSMQMLKAVNNTWLTRKCASNDCNPLKNIMLYWWSSSLDFDPCVQSTNISLQHMIGHHHNDWCVLNRRIFTEKSRDTVIINDIIVTWEGCNFTLPQRPFKGYLQFPTILT